MSPERADSAQEKRASICLKISTPNCLSPERADSAQERKSRRMSRRRRNLSAQPGGSSCLFRPPHRGMMIFSRFPNFFGQAYCAIGTTAEERKSARRGGAGRGRRKTVSGQLAHLSTLQFRLTIKFQLECDVAHLSPRTEVGHLAPRSFEPLPLPNSRGLLKTGPKP